MRVKFVTTYPPTICGIAIYSRQYVEALKKSRDVDVVSILRPKLDPLYFIRLALDARKNADIAHIQFDCGFFGTLTAGPLSISGMYTPLFYFLLKLPGGPGTVTTVHELIDAKRKYSGRALYWPMRIYYTLVYRPMVKLSDAVILHTSESAKTLSQYATINNTEIVPLACTINPTFLPEEECKVSLGLTGKRVVTMFGFISRFKGHDLAIEAMKDMPEDVFLYIVGEGRSPEDNAYIDALKENVKQAGLHSRVIFAGYVNDDKASAVMCASDIVLMPYRHVVQSSALNYALAYLKPVLASDMGGFAEVAREYGCIETFRPEDIGDLKAKLIGMLDDRSRTDAIVSRAPAYVKAVSLESVIERTDGIYERILYGRKPRKSP